MTFDARSHPIVSGSGGLWRYSEEDGWLPLGKLDASQLVQRVYPADDGGVYAIDGSTLYKADAAEEQEE